MKTQISSRMRQVVDWEAAIVAGMISGLVVFVINFFLTWFILGDPWLFLRMSASIPLGGTILASSPGFDPAVSFTGLLVHLLLSIFYGCLIAISVYRWGLLVGFFGGALLSLAIYSINFFAVSFFFPWFYPMRSWIIVLNHVLFGALAGGIYEILEEEEFVQVESEVEI